MIVANVSSFQSLGTLDGPGIRYVVFLQGCPFQCIYCHNPETWDSKKKVIEITPEELMKKILPYKPYFGEKGGVTISGGEPLLQIDFLIEFFSLCKKNAITTALDTTGAIQNEKTKELLNLCDYVLLDIKFSTNEQYLKYTGADLKNVLDFLKLANTFDNEIILRQVVLKTINDSENDKEFIKKLMQTYKNISKIDYLPLSKLCIDKYERMGIPFLAKDMY